MSIGQTEMSIRPMDEQKCPLDIQMCIRPLDKQKCPLDIYIYVHSSIGRTEMSIGHPNVRSSIGRMDEWTLSNGNHSSLLST